MSNPALRVFISLIVIQWLTIMNVSADVIRVPGQHTSIQAAVESATTGDTILIARGIYKENIHLQKKLTIGSDFLLSGDPADTGQTIIDGQTNAVFTITGPAHDTSVLIGLTIRNGDDGIMASAPFHLFHSIVTGCKDGIDYETGGSGICRYNLFEDNLDDAIDLDGALPFILIEHNVLRNNEDDGIEIRLHDFDGPMCYCRIAYNEISGNGEDGIQFIDYPDVTPRVYIIERNLILNNDMVGIGLMDSGDTKEDYRGAQIPEPIYLFNNTISNNNYGITGGANLLSINNIIEGSRVAGAFNIRGESFISHTLFSNPGDDTLSCGTTVEHSIFADPLLDENYLPGQGSPVIDKATRIWIVDRDTLLHIDSDEVRGIAPDIGRFEYGTMAETMADQGEPMVQIGPNPFLDGFNIILPGNHSPAYYRLISAEGRILVDWGELFTSSWIDAGHLNRGIYFFLCRYNGMLYSHKLLKI